LWMATLVSNTGSWMHDIGAGWLMTSLAPTPVMVALVQTATTLPVFLLAMPAGALADILDRRRYLIVVQCWLAAVAACLSIVTLLGLTSAWLLVALTFAMGIGTAMMLPAWAAVTPEVVPRKELPAAIALNSMGMNTARAIGPAIAGVVVAAAGAGAVFALNAVSYVAVIYVLFRWQRQHAPTNLPAERFFTALRTGARFARHAPALHAAAFRGLGFFLFASASWALLPLVARTQVGGGPQTFGVLVACIGLGAVSGAVLLPSLRQRYSRDVVVAVATVLYALAMLGLARLQQLAPLCIAMLVSGAAWIAVLSSLQVAAQLALPNWVRSRGLAVFMCVFMGSMAGGSLLWGYVAQQSSIQHALSSAAVGAIITIALTWRWKLTGIENSDLSPSMHWPEPMVSSEVAPDRGPVMVTVKYAVQAAHTADFLRTVRQMGTHRRRDGAYAWGIYEDTTQPGHYLEYFLVESWLEHLRQHERVTHEDRLLQEQLQTYLVPGSKLEITHFVAPELQVQENMSSRP
ncbi:MAG: MFS transporter, partial [Pseudomonadales bacterium]